MHALNQTAARALKAILAQQPLGPAKVAFAWRMAAGPTMAAATTVRWGDRRLYVRAKTETWRQEVVRARPLVFARLCEMIGPDAIQSLEIEAAS